MNKQQFNLNHIGRLVAFNIFVLTILCSNCGLGQETPNLFNDSIQRLEISYNLEYNYGSTVMNSRFLNKIVFGGRINREMKDEAYENLGSNNRLGGDFKVKLESAIPIDTIMGRTGISIVFGLGQEEHIDASFSSDLFQYAFDGNKQFRGESANIGGTRYNYYKFQYLDIGFRSHRSTDYGNVREGAVLSIIKGEDHEALTVSNGSIFTENLGRKIDIDLNYGYNSSDTTQTGLSAFNGIGLATRLFTEFYLKNGDRFNINIDDLGFIYWNKSSIDVFTDSSYTFQGIDVENIFDINDELLNKLSKDSLLRSISSSSRKRSYSIALPTSINLSYLKAFNHKWKMDLGIYYRILSNYRPLIYSNYYYYLTNSFVIKTSLSFGGYGKLNTGIAFGKSFGRDFDLFMGTNNLEGLLIPSSGNANSGFVGLKAYF